MNALMLVLAVMAANSEERLKLEKVELIKMLRTRCTKQVAQVDGLEKSSGADQLPFFQALEGCAGRDGSFLARWGSALNGANLFPEAEAVYRRALKLEVTQASQLGLLMALVRQKSLSAEQKKDLARHLEYFRTHLCDRDDLCAGLTYVAWHQDDDALTLKAGERAIALGYPGHQPYFLMGTLLAVGGPAQRKRAIELMTEARKRGGPKEHIDVFLTKLGAPVTEP